MATLGLTLCGAFLVLRVAGLAYELHIRMLQQDFLDSFSDFQDRDFPGPLQVVRLVCAAGLHRQHVSFSHVPHENKITVLLTSTGNRERLTGERLGWSKALFNPEAGGGERGPSRDRSGAARRSTQHRPGGPGR